MCFGIKNRLFSPFCTGMLAHSFVSDENTTFSGKEVMTNFFLVELDPGARYREARKFAGSEIFPVDLDSQ